MSLIATFDVEGGLRHSIYLGGKADAKNYDKLVNRWKITHVLNCTPPKQTNIEAGVPNYFEKHSHSNSIQQQRQQQQQHKVRLVYHRIPIYDSPASLPELKSKHESAIITFVTKGLCHGNVFVHCSRGVSRSTTSVVLYLMAKRQFRYEAALALIRRRRPQAQPIGAFDEWLHERDGYYHKALRKKQSDDGTNETNRNADTDGDGRSETKPTEPTTVFTSTVFTHRNKKRKTNTPVSGAAIGPTLPAQPPSTPAIGPSPPPSSIGPELPPTFSSSSTIAAAVVVGPEPPPPAATTATTNTNTNTNANANTTGSIGPELPPGLALALVATGKKKSIGPELSP